MCAQPPVGVWHRSCSVDLEFQTFPVEEICMVAALALPELRRLSPLQPASTSLDQPIASLPHILELCPYACPLCFSGLAAGLADKPRCFGFG